MRLDNILGTHLGRLRGIRSTYQGQLLVILQRDPERPQDQRRNVMVL